MEPFSSYKVSTVTPQQVHDFTELTELSGISTTPGITEIILKMLSNGIRPEAIYHVLADLRSDRKAARTRSTKK